MTSRIVLQDRDDAGFKELTTTPDSRSHLP